MLAAADPDPLSPGSTCTRWWMEELIGAHVRASEPVCGEEPEAVEDYLAWLSEEQLHELDVLDARQDARAEAGREQVWVWVGDDEGPEQPEHNVAGSSEWQTAEEVGEGGRPLGGEDMEEGTAAAAAWMEQADHVMDVWTDVLGVVVDHGNGVSREERARCEASPYYVDWDGQPLLSLDYTPIW
ncbi:hypothetical protein BD413DRAFT_1485 [Trametes elegans]|nr:hypothetical protein BD413DRAFT_1485 [Trametes elegans]